MTSELSEQIQLVRWLRRAKVLFCAVPNGGARQRREAAALKMSGVEPGVPDLLIFDPPPVPPTGEAPVGVALELKSTSKSSRVSPAQKQWLKKLEARGWLALVAHGSVEARAQLRQLGYPL